MLHTARIRQTGTYYRYNHRRTWVNNYSYYDYDLKESQSKSGFFGLAASLYLKAERNKLAMNFGVTADLPAPVGPIDYLPEGTRSNIGSLYLEFVDHASIYEKVNFIAGENLVRYIYNLTSYEDSLPGYRKNDIPLVSQWLQNTNLTGDG